MFYTSLFLFVGVGNGNLVQYSFLENSIDRGACRATVHGVTKSQTRLSDRPHTFLFVLVNVWSKYNFKNNE